MWFVAKALHCDAGNGNAKMPMMPKNIGNNSREHYMAIIQEAK